MSPTCNEKPETNPGAWTEHEVAYASRIIQLLRLNKSLRPNGETWSEPIGDPVREKASRILVDLFLRKALRFSMEMDSDILEAWAFAMERESKRLLALQKTKKLTVG